MIRVGVLLIPADPWEETVARVRDVEAAGFHHLWVYDHVTWRRYRQRPWFSMIPWLTGLAAATTSIRLGPLVANPNIRHPLLLAKEAITLDHISNGRLTLGIGAGGIGSDATVLGIPKLVPSQRVDRMAEFVELLDGLLTQSIRSYAGNYYAVDDARVEPACLQKPRIPLAVAAGGTRSIGVAARFGDAWVTWGDTTLQHLTASGTERVVRRQLETLALECLESHRQLEELDRIFLIGNTEARPLTSIDSFVDFAGRYANLGFTDLVFHHPRTDDKVWNENPAIVDHIASVLPELARL